jgi:hypothetical protein
MERKQDYISFSFVGLHRIRIRISFKNYAWGFFRIFRLNFIFETLIRKSSEFITSLKPKKNVKKVVAELIE